MPSLLPSAPASSRSSLRARPRHPASAEPNGTGSPHRYLTHIEAAAYLRLSPRTLDGLVAEGQIHPARTGKRKRLYPPEILDDYLRLSGRPSKCR